MPHHLKLVFWGFFCSALFIHCRSENGNQYKEPANHSRGISLIKMQCLACHQTTIDADYGIGPSLTEIRQAYFSEYRTQNAFIERFQLFMKEPTAGNALMKEAVNQYGVMPKMMLNATEINAIASYLFNVEPGSDQWNSDFSISNVEVNNFKLDDPISVAKDYAATLKSELGKNLMNAIQQGGPVYAIDFCQSRAIPITDSISAHFNTLIQRVSDKPRNPSNMATESEKLLIHQWAIDLQESEEIDPVFVEHENQLTVYFPIETHAMCLTCHGVKGKNINEPTLKKIESLYPNDLATGYGEKQIRGLFRVTMQK
ncbi:MAG TPA: DUF3365 domain-containing protein [Saprospiraceae bacterium]|nr:DUF3365 domain-containing protein [Saprospiraceae bacterium]